MTISLDLLGEQVKSLQADARAIKRDLAMLRAQQGELPTVAQFQSGLSSIDERITELLEQNTQALARIEQMLADINRRVP